MTLDLPNYDTSVGGATNDMCTWVQCWWQSGVYYDYELYLVHGKNGSYYVTEGNTTKIVSEIYDNFDEACMTFLMMNS